MAHRLSFAASALVATFALSFVACNDAPGFKTKAKSPADVAKTGASEENEDPTATASETEIVGENGGKPQAPYVYSPGLTVSDVVAQACGMQAREKSVAPSFEFDSAALAEADRQVLSDVAKCLSEGQLKGKSVLLVGRADARGESEYNMTLGGSRADAVHRYLVDLGVGKKQLRATSRGEIDATGTDETTYAKDRRVDIELATP